jgi:hypothetical protein
MTSMAEQRPHGSAMQVCYVLACDGWNDYGAMVCISAATLRRHHPDVEIVVLSDQATLSHLGAATATLERFADRIIQVDDVEGNSRERSRILKTTMRSHFRGRFVFLDLDTVVLRRLDALFTTARPLAIALDYEKGRVDERDRQLYERLDSAHYPSRAFNSGVMSIDDSPLVHGLFDEWHRRWKLSRDLGRLDDQPSLNSTIAAQQFAVEVLAPNFNAMILYFPQRFRTCRVAHFLASTDMYRTLMSDLLDRFRRTQEVDWEAIEICVRDGHPWGRAPEPWQLLRSGNYARAAWARIRRALKIRSSN